MLELRRGFEADGDGLRAVGARAAMVDEFVQRLWRAEVAQDPRLGQGIAVAAVGGYGRAQLFPYSDIDLLVIAGKPAVAKDAVRRLSQALWDCGLQVALTTRTPKECERFEPGNAEFGLALLDLRELAGDAGVVEALRAKLTNQRSGRDGRRILAELETLTRERHRKYGETLFHLEPNIKDCPGGLRDTNVCLWVSRLRGGAVPEPEEEEFGEAVAFLSAMRCFLHWRHERDDNVLDWLAQDAAAESAVGIVSAGAETRRGVDPAYWMRVYFRHGRFVERRLLRTMEGAGLRMEAGRPAQSVKLAAEPGFRAVEGRIELDGAGAAGDPAMDPDVVLRAFAAIARTGTRLTASSEERIAGAIPMLSTRLEEGAGLWERMAPILTGNRAGVALRAMHALGVLDLILPEFHGIDALVIRDAYHRYTVDEHTFVLIDALHELERTAEPGAPEWRTRLGAMVRELQNPALLYLGALLHDTGKARAGDDHAAESARLAEGVLARLEMDPYDTAMVMQLIETHLAMSAALRRDIFDAETVRSFAAKVQTHESLHMLTVFTYADIRAVHPDALTPWKAENLWRLAMSTANQLDRNVDYERVQTRGPGSGGDSERLARLLASVPGQRDAVERFVEGFPERYLRTRPPEEIVGHFRMASQLDATGLQLVLRYDPQTSEMTLVSRDRPGLFAGMAAALAAWGMNVVSAEAFANAEGVVVDSFRFLDTFRTLELNESERGRFVQSVRDVVDGKVSAETVLSGRRRGRRRSPKVVAETSIEFDDGASASSTLVQVVAQDVPGLLRTLSLTLNQLRCNVEVALIDTEGETAIDVFYVTQGGNRLTPGAKRELRGALRKAIEENAL
ncbi:MAG TPA: HD domain-containing protein [Acidobacteriaceae bacterium]|jgi:[protein-PII] uridylyltransferase|nr:HD domain-containing protein [Acidobacteriaceae bacterium]